MEHGNLDSARFVQIMEGHVTDHDRAVAMERESEPMLAELRPGSARFGDRMHDADGFTEAAYFDARGRRPQG